MLLFRPSTTCGAESIPNDTLGHLRTATQMKMIAPCQRKFLSAFATVGSRELTCPGRLYNRIIESHEQRVPALRLPAAVYPYDTYPVAAATAAAMTDMESASTPCTQQAPRSTITPTPELSLELQRRNIALDDIPKSLKSQESTYQSTRSFSGPLAMEPCMSGLEPCSPGFTMFNSGSICVCYGSGSFATQT